MDQIANYQPDHDHDQHLDPALQHHEDDITTAPGGFNPFPLNFQRSDVPDEIKDGLPTSPMGIMSNPVNGHRAGSHGLGRTSTMLGEDGKPIPEDQKPPAGTEAYVKMRKINHKEVERKRRQTINEGLDELAKLIASPHAQPEKNKGAVLQKACNYINELKRNENANIEKYTMDKLLCDQQISDLTEQRDHIINELHHAQQRAELWKAACLGDETAKEQALALDGQ